MRRNQTRRAVHAVRYDVYSEFHHTNDIPLYQLVESALRVKLSTTPPKAVDATFKKARRVRGAPAGKQQTRGTGLIFVIGCSQSATITPG